MLQPKLLSKVIEVLNQHGIEYMITGSVVSSLQGEPRSTHDIDLVVAIHAKHIKNLVLAFQPPDYYLSEESIADAIRQQDMFNLIDVNEGDKVDFWILTPQPFDISRFSRRQKVSFLGIEMNITSPEDTIVAKLRWCQWSGGSEKQFNDALRVYEVQYEKLDISYIEHWTNTLKLTDLWQRLLKEAQPLSL